MKNVVIVDSVRTGLAKSHRGGFNITRADDMVAHLISVATIGAENTDALDAFGSTVVSDSEECFLLNH